jgi:hypothetical protein
MSVPASERRAIGLVRRQDLDADGFITFAG